MTVVQLYLSKQFLPANVYEEPKKDDASHNEAELTDTSVAGENYGRIAL